MVRLMERVEIPLKPWTQQNRMPVGAVRTLGALQLGCGPFLLLMGLIGLAGAIWGGQTEFWVGGPLVGLVGFLMVWNGLRLRRAIRGRVTNEPARFAAPHAFALEGDQVIFPAALTWEEERWPLAETTFSVGRRLGQDALVMESPGRQTRRFPAAGLAQQPADILGVVEQYRNSR